MNISNILIEERDLSVAQNICSWIEDPVQKEIMAAKILGIETAAKYFEGKNVNADKDTGLYAVNKILTDYDISDLYVEGCYIDVRVCGRDNLLVPKSHFEYNLLPAAYMFISISDDLKNAEVLGFILPQSVDTSAEIDEMYSVSPDTLVTFEEIKDYLERSQEAGELSEIDVYSYFEDTLADKVSFFHSLINSKDARELFKKIEKAQRIFKFVSASDSTQVQNEKEPAFEYSTVTSPSISEYEEKDDEEQEIIDTTPATEQNEEFVGEQTLVMSNDDSDNGDDEYDASGEEIRALFAKNAQNRAEEDENEEYSDSDNEIGKKQKKSPLLLILFLIIAIAGAGCYFFLTKSNSGVVEDESSTAVVADNNEFNEEIPADTENAESQDAMPIESIEKSDANKINNKIEGNAVAIPAIERNLDASVLVSNLRIDWEVPVGYASNTAAKRYLIKLGKVIQLNLKSELLLLNKPPLSNRIAIEIQYDNSTKKFNAVGILTSSGEKTIDDVIMQTVKKALNMKISTSIDSFAKIPGNPVLVIKL